MSSLPELLEEAVGRIEPSFGHDAILTTAGRRRRVRRWCRMSAAAAALTVCGGLVWVTVGQTDSSLVRTVPPSRSVPPPSTEISQSTREQLRSALAAWASFPIASTPRPLVLVSESPYAQSITFDNETKDAFDSGAFNEPASFPVAPPQSDGYPVIGAADALAALRAAATPVSGPHLAPTPLTITSIQLDHAAFQTDRGIVDLPTWAFTFRGVQGAASVLAVASPARFPTPPGALGAPGPSARLAPDGKTLTVSFTGAAAGTGPCTADYTIDQLASDAAVALNIQEHRHGTGSEACLQNGHIRTAVVTLTRPLGSRVLVNATAAPLAVQP